MNGLLSVLNTTRRASGQVNSGSISEGSGPEEDSVLPLFACLTVWTALNCSLIAIIDDDSAASAERSVRRETVLAYQSIHANIKQGNHLQARIFRPRHLNGSRLPLIVFLHGAGQRGYDNVKQLRTLPEQLISPGQFRFERCYVLAPQCPPESSWGTWISELEELVEKTIRNHRIDPDRVYLTGLSMGGFGSWQLAARRPDMFAAVAPVCGGGQVEWAQSLMSIPLWAVHGSEDTVVPPERSREMITAIQSLGGNPRYTELPEVGHDSWLYAYDPGSGVLDWMFQQQRSSKPE